MKRFFPIILCIALLLSGCGATGSVYSNYRALEQLRLVRTLGCDGGGGVVTLSASTGKQGEDDEILLLRRSGNSILRAIDSLQDYSPQGRLFYANVQNIVVGREAAEAGLRALLDFAERDLRIRLDAKLYLLSEGSAGDLIMGPGEGYDITEVLESVRQDVSMRGVSRVGTLRETAVSLSEYGAAPVCLLRAVDTEGSVALEEGGLSAIPTGYAILNRDGRLAGVVESQTAEAVSLLLGCPGTVSRKVEGVVLQFSGAGAEFRPVWDDGGGLDHMEIVLNVRAAVAETEGDFKNTDGGTAALEQALAESLEANLREAVELSRTLDADYLALAGALRRDDGERFRRLPEDWLKRLRCTVAVKATVDRSYDLTDSVSTEGG